MKKVTLKTICMLFATTFCSTAFAQTFPIEIEAEGADVFHYMSIKDEAGYSNGQRLEGQDTKQSYVQYNINGIENAGTYEVTVYYASGQDRHFYSKVNDQFPIVVATPDMGSWSEPTGTASFLVYFDAGDNVLEIGAYNAGDNIHIANLDKLVIDQTEEKIKRPTDMFFMEREAEDMDEIEGLATEGIANLSGGEGIKGKNGYAKYNITGIPEDGEYDILVYYADPTDRWFYVKANDDDRQAFQVKDKTKTWGSDHTDPTVPAAYRIRTKINLNEGDNVIELGHEEALGSSWAPNLDKFEILKIGTYIPQGGTGCSELAQNGVSVYANAGKIFINATAGNAEYTIISVLGKLVAAGQCDASGVAVELPAGIYIVSAGGISVKVAVK